MAGITDADFLNNVIPFGFDVATLGGFNLDSKTVAASEKIVSRGRNEFHFPEDVIFSHIESEALKIKQLNPDVKVSVNVRSTTPEPIIKVSKIPAVDIVEINCHCRQPEFLDINCGQNMLKRPDLKDFISTVVNNSNSEVSVKIRANVEGVDTLTVSKIIDESGADYLHVDAMNPGVDDCDFDLLHEICNQTDIFVIGNNSANSKAQIEKILKTGVKGFSIARAVISGKLDFDISCF